MKAPRSSPFDLFICDVPAGATVGVQITNLDTNTIVRARTTSVRKFPSGTVGNPSTLDVYKATLIAPNDANATYFVWWDVNGAYAGEELVVDPDDD